RSAHPDAFHLVGLRLFEQATAELEEAFSDLERHLLERLLPFGQAGQVVAFPSTAEVVGELLIGTGLEVYVAELLVCRLGQRQSRRAAHDEQNQEPRHGKPPCLKNGIPCKARSRQSLWKSS